MNNPKNPTQHRPIRLCSVVYQVISKVLADRLKALLRTVISDNQSAFIPVRLLTTDNVFIAFELFHFFKNQRWDSGGHLAIKLDMSKAYDS